MLTPLAMKDWNYDTIERDHRLTEFVVAGDESSSY